MSKFVSTMRKGFQMTFANGITASVQWGVGNYCDNHFPEDRDFSCSKDAKSTNAEVACWRDGARDFSIIHDIVPKEMDNPWDDVIGWLTTEEVLDFLNACRNYKGGA